MAEHFGDRVRRWATHNEPWRDRYLGYVSGEHAAGHHRRGRGGRRVAPPPARAWSLLQAMRAEREGLELGIVINPSPVHVDERTDPDIARRIDGTLNRWFLDPVITGRYPSDVVDDLGRGPRPCTTVMRT